MTSETTTQAPRPEHPVVAAMRTSRSSRSLWLADMITRFAGSMTFVYLHVVAFAA